jgi:SAM-dependent methyltransferase
VKRGRHQAVLILIQLVLGGLTAWAAFEPGRRYFMVGAGFASAVWTVWIYRRGAPRTLVVLAVAVILRLFWVALPPTLSDDSYRYGWDGMLVLEGQNPYEYVPADSALARYQDHPTYAGMNSRDFYSVYPPASQLVFAAASWLSKSSHPASFFFYKAILVLLELLALLLMSRMVPRGLLMLFAWSPVVILAGAGQAHSDALLALPLVAAVLLARKGRWGGAGGLLAVSAMVKVWPALAAPMLLRRRWPVIVGALVGLAVSAPFLASYVVPNVRQSLDLYVRYFEFNAGLYYAVKKLLLLVTGDDWSKQLGPALRQAYLLVVLLLWVLAWRRKWTIESLLFAIVAWYLIASTTVHPWYFYPVLLLAALRGREAWAWYWVSIASMGTYLLYVDGPYWPFVWLGWGGFAVLAYREYGGLPLESLLRGRAAWKAEWVAEYLGPRQGRILDVGGAEGYVAERLGELTGGRAVVVEVRDARRTGLEYHLYDGRHLPFETDEMDACVCVFTLHHAADPVKVLTDVARVTDGPIVIVESVYQTSPGRRLLQFLDVVANRVRSIGQPAMDPESLDFHTAAGWRSVFSACGLDVVAEDTRYNVLHKKHLFKLVRDGR